MGHSPRQHGVQQNAQAPNITAFVVALALEHLAGKQAGEHGQSAGQRQVALCACQVLRKGWNKGLGHGLNPPLVPGPRPHKQRVLTLR